MYGHGWGGVLLCVDGDDVTLWSLHRSDRQPRENPLVSTLLTVLLVVTLFAIMMGTFACDEVRTLRRRVHNSEDRLAELEARLANRPRPAVSPQRNTG